MIKSLISLMFVFNSYFALSQESSKSTIFIGSVRKIKCVNEMGLMYRVYFDVDSIVNDDYSIFNHNKLKASLLTHYHFNDHKDPYWYNIKIDESCGFPFFLGKKYIVYVTRYHHGSLAISGMSKTRELYPYFENGKYIWR